MTEGFEYEHPGLSRELLMSARSSGQLSSEGWGLPQKYRKVAHRIRVGHGEQSFERLSRGVLSWEIQRRAGLQPRAESDAIPGATVICGFGWGRLRLPVPCRVVWSERTSQLAGFGYGTLPGHPARGEEAFAAELQDDGGVYFSLLAFSRPAPGVYTLGAPASRVVQALVTKRYLRAAQELAG